MNLLHLIGLKPKPIWLTDTICFVPYHEADALIAQGYKIYTPNEDGNCVLGMVWLAKVEDGK